MRIDKNAASFIAGYINDSDCMFDVVISDELYNNEYVVIGYQVTNAGVIYDEPIFTNDLEDEYYNDCNQIFLVSEVYEDIAMIKDIADEMLKQTAQNDVDDAEVEAGKNYDECRGY